MPEFYELKSMNNRKFSNLILGITIEIKLKKEDNYDYHQDVTIRVIPNVIFFNVIL